MSKINFQPIFDYIDQNNHVLKEEIMIEVRSEIRGIRTSIANMAGDIKTIKDELLISNHRTERLENWGKAVGDKVNIPLVF